MLERIAATLLQATEAIAAEQLAIDRAQNRDDWRGVWLWVPVIVTNATLSACSFNPSEIDAGDGFLPSSATFQNVDAVRFFKNLAFDVGSQKHKGLTEANLAKSRTVLVVNEGKLKEFLRRFEIVEGIPPEVRKIIGLP